MALPMETLKKSNSSQKTIKFHKGGLHQTLGVKQGQKIPENLMEAALAGRKGKKAKKEAIFAKNVLTGGKK